MRFEEANLVLCGGVGGVCSSVLHAEVVVHFAGVDGRSGLRDQLGAKHGLTFPVGSRVQCELGSLLRHGVGGVLEVGAEVDVVGDVLSTVDVVLVCADLVGPAPVIQIRAGGVVVESSIPENGT